MACSLNKYTPLIFWKMVLRCYTCCMFLVSSGINVKRYIYNVFIGFSAVSEAFEHLDRIPLNPLKPDALSPPYKIWRYWPCVVFANFDVEQTPSSCLDALFLSGFVSLIVMRLLRQISLPYFLKKVLKSRFCGFEIGLSRGSVNRKS